MKTYLQKRNNGDVFDVFEDFFKPMFYDEQLDSMRTDIKETDDAYQMEVELPGLDKQDIHIDLKDGYLNISASKSEKKDGDKKDNYIHRERSFSCQRSYYVGDIRREDIKAKYENGMLNVTIPKEAPKQENQQE